MKKKTNLSLEIKKVSISKLNSVKGGDPVMSVDLPCIYTEYCSIAGVNCKTFLTASDSIERC
ncbi:hypothetical protein [uncultured Kordia sp.]|uniref:hypothetical protein n=1 Tax=uncultured Kordia sp. TaxID=507699 RepID=UPI00263676C8|nr:hypothetical protein [uncultured Kordia sp.]